MRNDNQELMSIDLRNILIQAFSLYKKGPSVFIAAGLIYGFANVSDALIYKFFHLSSMGVFLCVSFLITSWASMIIFYASAQIIQGRDVDLISAFRYVKGKYIKFIYVSFLLFGIVMLGSLFFIIPGLYFMTIFLLVDLLVVLEDHPLENFFRRSAYLIKGYFGTAFLCFALMTFLLVFPAFVLQLFKGEDPVALRTIALMIGVFIFPYYNIVQVAFYYRLKEIKQDEELSEDRVDFISSSM
jgi:hypothetical protein